jgi:hypothetical protein
MLGTWRSPFRVEVKVRVVNVGSEVAPAGYVDYAGVGTGSEGFGHEEVG